MLSYKSHAVPRPSLNAISVLHIYNKHTQYGIFETTANSEKILN